MGDMGIDGRVKVNDRHVHTKKPEHCEKAFCCHNCSGKLWEKIVQVLFEVFSKLPRLKKGHQEKGFWSRGEAETSECFRDALFSTEVSWKKLQITREPFFLTVCPNNYDNRVLFRIFWFFRMNVAIITLISQYKNTILLYLIRHFDAHRSIICPVLEHYNRSILCLFYIWKFCMQNFQI